MLSGGSEGTQSRDVGDVSSHLGVVREAKAGD